MPRRIKRLLMISLMSFTIMESFAANASALDLQEMTDICMYLERSMKDYVLIGMEIDYDDPKEDLLQSVKQIDFYFQDLESKPLDTALISKIKHLHERWDLVKPQLLSAPSKEATYELYESVRQITEECKDVSEAVAQDTHNPAEHDVVLIATLGMDSQQLGALYMMLAWGVEDDHYQEEVGEIVTRFQDTEAELLSEPDELVPFEVKTRIKDLDGHFNVIAVLASRAGITGRFSPTQYARSVSNVFGEIRSILNLEKQLVE